MLSAKSVPRRVPLKTGSRLPWPIPPEGFRVEVIRWFHPGTETRNGWESVYFAEARPLDFDLGKGRTVLSLRGWRFRLDYLTKRESGFEMIGVVGREIEIRTHGKQAAEELCQAFEQVVEQVRRQAKRAQAAYERATD